MLASTCRSCTRSIRSGFYCSSCRDLTDRNIILLPNGYYLLWRKFKAGSFCAGSTFAKMISKHHKIKKIVINTKNSLEISRANTINKLIKVVSGRLVQLVTNSKQQIDPKLNSFSLVSLFKETENY